MPLTPASRFRRLVLIAAGLAGLAGCAGDAPPPPVGGPHAHRYAYELDAFGRAFHVTLYAESPSRADEAAAAVRGRLDDLSLKLDASRRDSELSRLVGAAGGPWRKVSDDLLPLLQQTRRLADSTRGAADVTDPPAADLWRAAFDAGVMPADDALAHARAAVGFRNVQIDPIERRVRLLLPGVRLDLGQRAAAYAADRAIEELVRHGVTSALIDAGDLAAASGPPPGRAGWPVTLPPAGKKPKPRTVELRNGAVVLLGDGTRVATIDGRLYADRVDPRTGLGATPRQPGRAFPVAVTVTAGKALPAAQTAAAVIALGPDGSAGFRRTLGGVGVEFRAPAAARAPGGK